MTITQALRQARDEIDLSFFGGSYVLRALDPERHIRVESAPRPYAAARAAMTEARHRRALELLGWEPFDAAWAAGQGADMGGSLELRVARSLRA